MVMRATATVRTNSKGSSAPVPLSGVPSTCTSMLMGTLSGWLGRLASVAIMSARSRARFTHAHDAAAADVDARVAHMAQGLEPVLIGTRGDDLAVERFGGVEIVVVVVEAGIGEALRLGHAQHAEGDAGLQTERLDAGHHVRHRLQVAVFGAAPGGAHAVAGGAGFPGAPGLGQHLVFGHQLARFEPGVVARALRAVGAVLRAAAGLDAEQRRHLHLVRVEVAAMGSLRAEHQLGEGQREQHLDLRRRPSHA